MTKKIIKKISAAAILAMLLTTVSSNVMAFCGKVIDDVYAAPAPVNSGAGNSQNASSCYGTYGVSVAKNYLALRTAKAYDYYNEIGKLYNGDTVDVYDTSDSTYWWVYSPKYNRYGYVNKDYIYYISGGNVVQGPTYTVSVAKGYLALRTAKAYDYRNEIGELYTGDTVQVQDTSDPTYWWVYSPKYNKYGYVNRNYLY